MQQLLFNHADAYQLKSETSPWGQVILVSIDFGDEYIVLEKYGTERKEYVFTDLEEAKRCYKEALNRTHKKRR